MKKNQSFKVCLSAALENIEIISDFETASMQNPPEPPKVNLRYRELKLNKNIHCQNFDSVGWGIMFLDNYFFSKGFTFHSTLEDIAICTGDDAPEMMHQR